MKKANVIAMIVILLATNSSIFAQNIDEQLYKFDKVYSIVNSFYVDTVNKEKLVEDAIVGMLKELDPHTVYISKDEVKRMNEPLQGNFDGVGIQFNILDDTLFVVSPIEGGPSKKLGIQAGDRIINIDSELVAGVGLKNSDVVKKLRGEKGTKVKVDIQRRGVENLLEFEITRDKIPIYSVSSSYKVNKDVGYIKLARFARTTMREYYEAIMKLKSEGVTSLIFDLQGNGGGYLDIAFRLADEFLKQDKMIVYTEGITSPKRDYKSTSRGEWEDGKVVFLVDEGSASASEIVSGAMQDWDRAVLVGRRTFGKGLVQKPFDLPGGAMMRLTIARYYTPTGRLIQKSYKGGIKEYSKDLINRYNNGELSNKDSIHFPDSLKYETLINKRSVYGGGGIMPDIFVPLDTTSLTKYYGQLLRKGTLNRFVLNYVDANRETIKTKYTDFAKFKNKYKITDKFLSDLKDFATEQKIKIDKDEKMSKKEQNRLKIQIKAMIASDIYERGVYWEIINEINPIFQKGLEVISNDKLFNKLIKG